MQYEHATRWATEAIDLVLIFALLAYIGTKKLQQRIKLTLSLTLLLTLTVNPQSTKLQSEINWISYYSITITMYEM